MNPLRAALEDPASGPARLRTLLQQELQRGVQELGRKRSGYEDPVLVAFTDAGRVALPVGESFRADPASIEDRAWSVVAAAVGALQAATELPPAARAEDLVLRAGGAFVLSGFPADPELAALAFDEAVAGIDRLRASAVIVPDDVVDGGEPREPIGAAHPLKVAEAVARMGGDPAAPTEDEEEAVLALLGARDGASRPHDDPDPAMRVARRILQRLDGMGKWGGYHTDFAHLARGFKGNDRALADSVGEALLQAGLLAEKPSVGQRHVFLNPRRAGEIKRLIEDGTVPVELRLPRK